MQHKTFLRCGMPNQAPSRIARLRSRLPPLVNPNNPQPIGSRAPADAAWPQKCCMYVQKATDDGSGPSNTSQPVAARSRRPVIWRSATLAFDAGKSTSVAPMVVCVCLRLSLSPNSKQGHSWLTWPSPSVVTPKPCNSPSPLPPQLRATFPGSAAVLSTVCPALLLVYMRRDGQETRGGQTCVRRLEQAASIGRGVWGGVGFRRAERRLREARASQQAEGRAGLAPAGDNGRAVRGQGARSGASERLVACAGACAEPGAWALHRGGVAPAQNPRQARALFSPPEGGRAPGETARGRCACAQAGAALAWRTCLSRTMEPDSRACAALAVVLSTHAVACASTTGNVPHGGAGPWPFAAAWAA
jgi:hypothetical protein